MSRDCSEAQVDRVGGSTMSHSDAYAAVESILTSLKSLKDFYVGREGKLQTAAARKYSARTGLIVDVMPDAHCGLRLCVMVWSLRPTRGLDQFLNGNPETRSYWPWNAVHLTGRRFVLRDCSTGWVEVKE